MSMKTIFRKELQEIRSDLRRPVFLFGAALAYLIVFGILYLPNIVTAVLASFRGYDTLGETTVVFTAGAGIIALLRRRKKDDTSKARGKDSA